MVPNLSVPRRRWLAPTLGLFAIALVYSFKTIALESRTAGYEGCDQFPDLGNVAIVVKTGATEAVARLPAQLSTSLRCVRDPILISDLAQKIGGYEIHDVLANVTPSVMENQDFDIYRLQQEYSRTGRQDQIPLLVNMPIDSDDWRLAGHNAAWNLDKYKDLHEIELAWRESPYKDWYFLIDADTYLNWPNFLRWVDTMNGHEVSFFGNAVRMVEHPFEFYFAHGGSGMLLSGAAVKEFAHDRSGLAHKWDHRIPGMPYGDYVLAVAMYEELGLNVTNASPTVTGDEPAYVPWHSDGRWCQPVVTLHHVEPIEQEEMMLYEVAHPDEILRYQHIYSAYSQPLPVRREDWHNAADDLGFELASASPISHEDVDSCQQQCDANEACLQYMFVVNSALDSGTRNHAYCFLSRAFKFGKTKPPSVTRESVEVTTSGWRGDRIETLIGILGDCDGSEVVWPKEGTRTASLAI